MNPSSSTRGRQGSIEGVSHSATRARGFRQGGPTGPAAGPSQAHDGTSFRGDHCHRRRTTRSATPPRPCACGASGALTAPVTIRDNIAAGLTGALTMKQRVARLWLAVSTLMMITFGVARDALPWLWLPPIVPAFHFWRSTMAALPLFAGAAVWTLADRCRTICPLL